MNCQLVLKVSYLLNGTGVPCGDMKGVLHSDVDPKVAAREISEEAELNPPDTFPDALCPGSRWSGNALPELCRDLNMCTGVLRGEMNGLATGDCGREFCLGEIGWKLKCLLRVPGLGWRDPPAAPPAAEPLLMPMLVALLDELLHITPPPVLPEVVSCTTSGLKLTLRLWHNEVPTAAAIRAWFSFEDVPGGYRFSHSRCESLLSLARSCPTSDCSATSTLLEESKFVAVVASLKALPTLAVLAAALLDTTILLSAAIVDGAETADFKFFSSNWRSWESLSFFVCSDSMSIPPWFCVPKYPVTSSLTSPLLLLSSVFCQSSSEVVFSTMILDDRSASVKFSVGKVVAWWPRNKQASHFYTTVLSTFVSYICFIVIHIHYKLFILFHCTEKWLIYYLYKIIS